MSEALERIEMIASGNLIRDMGEIHRIMCSLLNLSYEEFGYQKCYYNFLADDITRGFLVDEMKVRKCTLREIFTIMAYMPGNPWFKIKESELWFAFSKLGRDFYSAAACFYMTEILITAERTSPLVRQFMHVSFSALMQYLDYMSTLPDKKEFTDIPKNHDISDDMKKTRRYTFIYVRENNPNRPEIQTSDISVGDILQTVHRRGNRAWMLGNETIDDYAEKMKITYAIVHNLFMNSIRKSLIDAGKDDFLKIMDRCSEFGIYEHSEQIDFSCINEERR